MLVLEKLKTASMAKAEASKNAQSGGGIDEQKARAFLDLHLAGRTHPKLVGSFVTKGRWVNRSQ